MHPTDYWLKQAAVSPLFPDILWSRPESRHSSGKLLIIGGHAHGFSSIGQAYSMAMEAGAGVVRVLLPDVLRKTVGGFLENAIFAPSNQSGGFAKTALAELIDASAWADAILLGGEFGRNSETAMLMEQFMQKYDGKLVITRDAIDYFYAYPELILDRKDTLIVGTTDQLHKLAIASHFTEAISPRLDLVRMVDVLHNFAGKHNAQFITQHQGNTIVVVEGRASTTKTDEGNEIWRLSTATKAAVFWIQNTHKIFEALTTSVFKSLK